jgi:hypothetical protein
LISFQYVSSLLGPFLWAALDLSKIERKWSNSLQFMWEKLYHCKAWMANKNSVLTCHPYWSHFPEHLQREAKNKIKNQLFFSFFFCFSLRSLITRNKISSGKITITFFFFYKDQALLY